MKKSNPIIAAFAALVMMIALSCSEENNSTNNTAPCDCEKYTKYTTGNYWIFDDYIIDKNGERLYTTDRKHQVIEPSVFRGKECNHGSSFYSNGNKYLDCYMYCDCSRFYATGHVFFWIDIAFSHTKFGIRISG